MGLLYFNVGLSRLEAVTGLGSGFNLFFFFRK